MRYIVGHNSYGVDRSGSRKTHYVAEDHGYETPCWIWQLKKTHPTARSSGGYGTLRAKGKEYLAHRYYYEQHRGPIPEGLTLDHLCRVRHCVNPEHLEPVTHLENVRRGRSMKLTLEDARRIEWLVKHGHRTREVADLFSISRQTVDLIRLNGADGPRRPR